MQESSQNNAIDIQHLKKSFNGRTVLKDINMQIKTGETLAVMGSSGTGKSVLIKCIIGLITPDEGSLNVLGKDVSSLNNTQLDQLRLSIGFLFQSGALYDSMTVKENLEFPVRRHLRDKTESEIRQMVEEALSNVGLSDAINKSPSELSGGMRKRISLARTIILNPKIILYDEPTTGLDPITSKEISELIRDLQKKYNTTSVVITHDLACAAITSDRIIMLKEGLVVTEGILDDLVNSNDEWVHSFFKSGSWESIKNTGEYSTKKNEAGIPGNMESHKI